jgi:hypothetical protein
MGSRSITVRQDDGGCETRLPLLRFQLTPDAGPLHSATDVRVTGTLGYTDSALKLKAVCERRISVFPEFFLRIWGAKQIGVVLTDEICRACGIFSVDTPMWNYTEPSSCCILKEATGLKIMH